MFFDPLCAECWALEPIMKKLKIEYGNYFTMKHVIKWKDCLLLIWIGSKSLKVLQNYGIRQPVDLVCLVMEVYGLKILSLLPI